MKKLVNYLLLLYIFILPLIPDVINGHNMTSVTQGCLGLLIVIYIVKSFVYRKDFIKYLKGFFTDPLTIFMVILCVIMLITSFEGINVKLGVKETIRFASYIFIYFIVKFEDIEYKNIIKVFMVSISIILVFGIVQFFTGIGASVTLGGYKFIRVESTIDNPNSYGGFLNIIIFPIILLLMNCREKGKKIFLVVTLIAIIINIGMTMSRNAMLGLFTGILALIVLYSLKYIFVLIPAVAAALLIPSIRERIIDISDKAQNYSRIGVWNMALDLFKKNPIKGIGNGNFVENYPLLKHNYKQLAADWAVTYPTHNSYLKVLCELGIFGGVSFAVILISALIKIKKSINICKDDTIKSIAKGFLISFIVFLVMNCIDNLFFVPKLATYVWIMVAMLDGIMYKEGMR
ncbi:MAG: O-antigen ligase family protein [Inconstantimicrobium porci]|uniref:O-antigen ligase family protein n=2 Tax=Inconstantimicrobium porci TaxID=2652291 RepID=UPI002A90F614|nr:O-antigen ligase family protein [Inconstantimicrobium porci]MDY5912359.1 O-antigen ligase family protein [Inconstantimicrobium porci]